MTNYPNDNSYSGGSSSGFANNASFIFVIFLDRDSIEDAYRSLESRGYVKDEVSLLMSDNTRDSYFAGEDDIELGGAILKGAETGSAIAAIGNGTVLPGLGLIVAGPLAATLAGVGGLTGGLIGALVNSGIPEERAQELEEGIRSGGIVMGVKLRSNEDADYFENEYRQSRGEQVYGGGGYDEKEVGGHSRDISRTTINTENVEYQTESKPPVEESAPRYKQIAAWITEREKVPTTPLVVNETYTLNFRVGAQIASNLIESSEAKIAESDIPDNGLETEWVVTAKNIRLDSLGEEVSVASTESDDSTVWTATFTLQIPKSSDSLTKQLKITPLAVEDAELHILIFAKNKIYRQFLLELSVKLSDKPSRGLSATDAVKITHEVIHSPAAELNPYPAHEWLTPPGTLNITVLRGDTGADVRGDLSTGKINTQTSWHGNEKSIAPAIKNLREAAGHFTDDADAYLNDIDANDFLQRLSDAAAKPNSFIFRDNPDALHSQTWNDKISVSDKLRRFAAYGYQLYEAIFPRKTDLREWLDELSHDQFSMGWRINISWSEISGSAYIPNIPWGLIYTSPPPASGQPVDALKFFGLRFRLEYTAYDIRTPKSPALGNRNLNYKANCLYWGEQHNDEATIEAVWQQNQWKQRANQVFIPAGSSSQPNPMDALLKMLDSPAPNPMRFLYLFCHCEVGDGGKPVLRFGSGNKPADLVDQISLGSSPLADEPIIFVNACTSAAGNPYTANQLVETFFRRDCRAFLGTEIYMPIALASRFAIVFNSFLYREIDPDPISAGEAVYQSRLFLWHQYRNIGGIFYSYINQYDLFMADEAELKKYAR